ncbi:MAG: hypothetical protein CM15mV41_0260 [Caudoviricetes sp.]|nr:MAG: hypothetical protein CM15mV41_0260 [Caudoviricetes sp.]
MLLFSHTAVSTSVLDLLVRSVFDGKDFFKERIVNFPLMPP